MIEAMSRKLRDLQESYKRQRGGFRAAFRKSDVLRHLQKTLSYIHDIMSLGFIYQWTKTQLRYANITNKRVLDIGCGQGILLKEAAKLGNMTVGLDFSRRALRRGLLWNGKMSRIQGDGFNLPFKNNTFDAVIGTELLDHVADDEKTLREIQRVLAANGLLLLSVANGHSTHYKVKGKHPLHVSNYSKETVSEVVSHYFKIQSIELRGMRVPIPFHFTLNLSAQHPIATNILIVCRK